MQRMRQTPYAVCVGTLLTTLALLISGCGDDSDNGNTPTGDPGIYGVIADSLEARVDKGVRDHAEFYESLEYFAPKIRSILAQSVGQQKATGDLNASCWASDVVGHSFGYNGTEYIGTQNDTLGPAVRFTLYRLGTNGTPILSDTIGNIRLICGDEESENEVFIQLQSGPRTVASFQYFQAAAGVSYLFGHLEAIDYYPTYVSGQTDLAGYVLRFAGESGGGVGLQRQVMSADDTRIEAYHMVSGSAWVSIPSSDFRMHFHVNSHDNVTEGYATYYDHVQSGQVACISSGSLDSPDFTQPTAHCSSDTTRLAVNQAELAAMRHLYTQIYALWSHVNSITGITQTQ